MPKHMLIDATHAEETRVVVLDGNRLEDFDVETATKRQIKGNIYLAKVIRVEPSLQAAFVEYGGNRHGFLAFAEIHPDYYQIPVADRQRLMAMQAEDERAMQAEDEAAGPAAAVTDGAVDAPAETQAEAVAEEAGEGANPDAGDEHQASSAQPLMVTEISIIAAEPPAFEADPEPAPLPMGDDEAGAAPPSEMGPVESGPRTEEIIEEQAPPETLGGSDDTGDEAERRSTRRFMRHYKIQEVIHRRQIMLIQVVKEERGNKGAALTTYVSLAGRFSVLMPNSPNGGGVSRKITSAADRKRLKEVMTELDIPDGMGLIVRTAGANRPKPEIKRDCEYLLRLWDDIRERTMASVAPALIYEEASLIKRSIRDVYTRDIEEIQVDGEAGFSAAREFMRMLMPSHVKKVQLWQDPGQRLFAKFQVESHLDAMLSPTVQLRSGGYMVINQTEALVAIDVNSGRSTRERNIEDTALRTNMEAAEELGRQLRLRDLAGLIVVDFIDMESRKHNGMVERKLKESLKNDRARIQVGSISHFGLLEMSRQRLRPSITETSLVPCPHCAGAGHVRSTESAALHILRAVEEEAAKRRAAEIAVHLAPDVALYIFNHKRERLAAIEAHLSMRVLFMSDPSATASQFRIEKLRAQSFVPPSESPVAMHAAPTRRAETIEPADADDEDDVSEDNDATGADAPVPGETAEEGQRRRKRRRRRRGSRRDEAPQIDPAGEQPDVIDGSQAQPEIAVQAGDFEAVAEAPAVEMPATEMSEKPRRRSRGGRRRRNEDEAAPAMQTEPAAERDMPVDTGPIFLDVADIFEAAERAEAEMLRIRALEQQAPAEELPPAPPQAPASEPAPPMTEPQPVHAAEIAAVEEKPAPAIQPTIIGQSEPDAPKKRGWWRRA